MAAPSPAPQERYRILRHVGRGGMGTVYEAQDLRLDRRVAWKETLVDTETSARAASREAQVLANLRHSHLPKVLDHFWDGKKQILIMEFIDGDDLQTLLASQSSGFSRNDVLRWAIQLLDVLTYLHSHVPPVVHRDIKPANLKLNSNSEIVLLDFGLAKGLNRTTAVSASRSLYGYTLNYAPPEQIRGDMTTPRSDLYSFGATMYHTLTGIVPPDAFTRLTGLVEDGIDPLRPLSEFNTDDDFARVIIQALSLKVEQRPANAATMMKLIRPLLDAPTLQQTSPHAPVLLPTFQGQTTLVADPPRLVETFEDTSSTNALDSKSVKLPIWVYVVGLIVAFSIGVLALLWSRSESRARNNANAPSKSAVIIPSPYRELTRSIVSVQMNDGSGKPLAQVIGFFTKADEIATTSTAIEGAITGQVTNGNETFSITSVSAVDRERGMAIIKVAGANQTALSLSSPGSSDSIKVTVIGRSALDNEISFVPEIDGIYKNSEDAIEIRSATLTAGSPVLDSRGGVVGLITSNNGNTVTAVSAQRISALMKKPSSTMSLAVAGANKLLHDFSKVGLFTESEQKPVSAAVERKVLTSAFGSYLTDESHCRPDENIDSTTPDGLRALRKVGQIVPRVNSTATGSFTKSGVVQIAYSIFVGECGAPHVVNWGTKRLVVFEGESIVANVDVKDHGVIDATYDLDGNGVSELLVSGAYMQMGHYFAWSQLVDLTDGKLRVIKDFKDVVEDSCGSVAEGNKRTVAFVYYSPTVGKFPEFRLDKQRVKCS